MIFIKRILAGTLLLAGITCMEATAQSQQIRIGQMAPEIELPDLKGKTVRLSSFRGKVVLVDFWASWCGPCVEEQPGLKRLHSKFSGKGFEILGVSLDSKKPAWENMVVKQAISWPQVSDLKFWMSPVAKTYEIEALPYNVLVDRQGKMIGLNLHGAELEAAVEKELRH